MRAHIFAHLSIAVLLSFVPEQGWGWLGTRLRKGVHHSGLSAGDGLVLLLASGGGKQYKHPWQHDRPTSEWVLFSSPNDGHHPRG